MNILLTNDDGFTSPGLQTMGEKLRSHASGHDVWIIAPDKDQSGVSHCITVRDPIRIQKIRDREYKIGGSPADCVRVALAALMSPDIIISGINLGENLGTDITYSGTVAAARQGAYMNIPSVAVSIFNDGQPFNFSPLAEMVARNLKQFVELWDEHHFININGPNHASGSPKIAITHPGQRHYGETPHCFDLPTGDRYCFLDGKAQYQGRDPGSDWDAVREGCISISPVGIHPVNSRVVQRYEETVFVE